MAAGPDPGVLSARMGGRLAAALHIMCGALVAVLAPILPFRTGASRGGLLAVGLVAILAGCVMLVLPWSRWPRWASLGALAPALVLIDLHNVFTGNEGFLYPMFFMVAFMWLGLAQARGWSLRLAPVLVAAYVTPLLTNSSTTKLGLASAVYAIPCCVLVGETVAWVSEHLRRSDQALRSSEERFRSLVEESADVVCTIARDATVKFASPAITRVLGFRPAEWAALDNSERIHPHDLEALEGWWEQVLQEPGTIMRGELRARAADGSYRWCALVLRNLLDDPAVNAVVANFTDITDRVEYRQDLAESERTFRTLFASNPQPMWVYDLETFAFLEVNTAAVEHYGFTHEEFLGMTLFDIRPPDEAERLRADLTQPRVPFEMTRHWRHRLRDGRLIDVEISSHALTFHGRTAALVSVQDVTDRVALEDQLRHQAFHDSLTGLANRALFLDRVELALRRSGRAGAGVAVLLLDLDEFKTVNDSLGHSAGDELLRVVAGRVRESLRPEDTAARLGGDEFAILVDGVHGPEEGRAVAARIRDSLRGVVHLDDRQMFVQASIGIALAADAERDVTAEDLLRNADTAMYSAKAAGKGGVDVFQPRMHAAALARLETEAELRVAIERDQLSVVYQPLISLRDLTVTGTEALMRWHHPDHGSISPARFIPVAEETGLITDMGTWILREACRQLVQWRSSGGPVSVGVNISARQLMTPTFVDDVRAALDESGADASGLVLELTETILLTDAPAVTAVLERLRRDGVRIALDDFGTGYSSLSYVRTLPLDILKIDRSFVSRLGLRTDDTSLVSGIISMARALGLQTVGEGVETELQATMLRNLGCDVAQGFLYAVPGPAEDLERSVFAPSGLDQLNVVSAARSEASRL